MSIRTIAPPASPTAFRARPAPRAAQPVAIVPPPRTIPDPSTELRRGELDAAVGQQVRELEYTLRRTTIPGRTPARPHQVIEDLARAVFADRADLRHQTARISGIMVAVANASAFPAIPATELRLAVLLRELGRTGVPDGLVSEPGPVDLWDGPGAPTMVLHHAATIAVASHEWWDGSGYPRGLRGAEIPEVARLAAVVEVFDAAARDHGHRPGEPLDVVATAMQALAGRRLDPSLVSALLGLRDEVDAIRAAFPTMGPGRTRPEGRPLPPSRQPGVSLTRREMEVLGLVAAGLPNKQIAHELGLRLNTVRNHVQNVLYKLRSHSKLEAVATAVRERLISYPTP